MWGRAFAVRRMDGIRHPLEVNGFVELPNRKAEGQGTIAETPTKERLEYGLLCINNWSLGFDLVILLLTPFAVLFSKNAS